MIVNPCASDECAQQELLVEFMPSLDAQHFPVKYLLKKKETGL